MATLTGQSIASSYEQLLHVDADGGGNSTTHVSVKDGDNGTTFALTLATDAVMITSTNRLEFGDDGTYINQSGDGILNITSDTEVEINATAVDLNGTLDVSGTLTQGGASQFNSTITVGVDGTGYDVIFYGDSPSSNMTWDQNGNTDGQLVLNDSRLFVDQGDDAPAVTIDSESSNYSTVEIYGKLGLSVTQDISGGRAAYFQRDEAEAGSSPLVNIVDNHTSNTQPALSIQQDGNAAHIEFTGVGTGGIKFKASATDSADANTLDDYEEGTWTAAFNPASGSLTINTSYDKGYYTKVGNICTIQGYFAISSISSPSGDLYISGLPFSASSADEGAGVAYGTVYLHSLAGALSGTAICYGQPDTANLYIRLGNQTDGGEIVAAQIDTGTVIGVGLTYRTA